MRRRAAARTAISPVPWDSDHRSTGVLGAGLHTLNEHIFEDSLLERAKFHAGMFMEFA